MFGVFAAILNMNFMSWLIVVITCLFLRADAKTQCVWAIGKLECKSNPDAVKDVQIRFVPLSFRFPPYIVIFAAVCVYE